MGQYLFRGINKQEREEGCILIPKSQDTFKAPPRLPIGLPFTLEERVEYAIRDHQSGFETSGVSTSINFEVAKKYASEKIIVKIDRQKLKEFEIKEHIVNQEGYMPINKDDDEVILVNENLKVFPKEILAEVINLE